MAQKTENQLGRPQMALALHRLSNETWVLLLAWLSGNWMGMSHNVSARASSFFKRQEWARFSLKFFLTFKFCELILTFRQPLYRLAFHQKTNLRVLIQPDFLVV